MAIPASTAAHARMIVLVADDDADTRDMYRCYLCSRGLIVEEACNGLEAIAKARAIHPDVVLAEVTLPGVDGFELCREIRQDPRTARIAFIAVTGYSRPDGADRARRAGCDAFLLKPTTPEQVLAEIGRLTR